MNLILRERNNSVKKKRDGKVNSEKKIIKLLCTNELLFLTLCTRHKSKLKLKCDFQLLMYKYEVQALKML